jgi:hypothetical protein
MYVFKACYAMFDIHIYYETITTIKLTNISITSYYVCGDG